MSAHHMELDLRVSFEERTLSGHVVHWVDAAEPARTLHFDTRDLEVRGCRVRVAGAWVATGFQPDQPTPDGGQRLAVEVAAGVDRVAIDYSTRPQASGLGWLEGPQTAGGDHPFLYTQGQCDHTRSWIPCVDTPSRRGTYDATIRIRGGLEVVMAAERLEPTEPGVFRFRMREPIPSYLIALAVGNLVHRELGPRTGVWAEPEQIDAAAWEFAETEQMVGATEAMFGPYRWGRYDLLVLPPGFPLGGMENPRLTFATPTVLTGDRSLVSLVAHELAHSWSGNLVTNATWEDFWLNEGFTVYLERRILEAIYGRERSEMEATLGLSRLQKAFAELPPRDTWLQLDLQGRRPDDAMTDVPYEKGYLFLRRLEEAFGRDTFDPFLRGWFDRHAFEARTTADFIGELGSRLFPVDGAAARGIDVRAWIHAPGLPGDHPRPHSTRLEEAGRLARNLDTGAPLAPHGDWVTHEWLRFLGSLPDGLSPDQMTALDDAYAFTASTNAEIQCEWLVRCVRSGYAPAQDRVAAFLTRVGRRKFLKPLYTELARTPEGRQRGQRIYATARHGYHRTARDQVAAILQLGPDEL